MTFRFTLTDPLGATKVISEPGGWDTAALVMERHPQFLSLVEYYKSSFQTYGSNGSEDGGRDWILAAEKTFGPDALIGILVELDNNDTGIYQPVYNGNLGIGLFVETLDQDHLLQIVFANQDFWSKFVSRFSNQVDIRGTQTETERAHNLAGTLSPVPYFNLPLPSQIIDKTYEGFLKNNIFVSLNDPVTAAIAKYFSIDEDTDILNEISVKYKYGFNSSNTLPFGLFVVEESGRFNIDFNITIAIPFGSGGGTAGGQENILDTAIGNIEIHIQKNDITIAVITGTDRSVPTSYKLNDGTTINCATYHTVTDFPFTGSIDVKRNDSIRFYGKIIPNPPSNIITPNMYIFGSEGWSNNYFLNMDPTYKTLGGLLALQSTSWDASLPHSGNPQADPTTGYPVVRNDGSAPIKAGDTWIVGIPGFIHNVAVVEGWLMQAKIDSPGTTDANWWVSQISLYYGKEAYGQSHLNVTFGTISEDSAIGLFTATGTNAYAVTDNSLSGYVKGFSRYIQFQNANTGASTLNFNGLGAKPIVHLNGNALVANDIVGTLTASGTNTYLLSAYPSLFDLSEGLILTVRFTNANTAASTLNVNSIGAKSILNTSGGALVIGDITAGSTRQLVFDGTHFILQPQNNQNVIGQVYVVNYDGTSFILTLLSSTDGLKPTANKTAQAFMTHDVMAGICDRITDTPGLFHSDYLGNRWTSPAYPADGCGSLLANLKGLHVRGFTLPQKSYFSSAQNWHDGINPIYCLGIGYEPVSGIEKIVCEPIAHFFDKSSMSILLSNVQSITRSYDPDWQFNSIDYGYSKWESQDQNGTGIPSGIDDPQAGRTRNTLFKIIGKKLSIMSSWIAASLAIETIRRKGAVQTANYTYDNETVVIKLRSNGDGTFTPELNENFSSITDLKNPETRYNNSITPIRNFLRWLPLISGCLQNYLTSFFTFASGSGNYNMGSTMTTSCPGDDNGVNHVESENVPVSSDFIFLPKPLEINHYLDFDDYVTFRTNKNKAIGISQTEAGHVAFFVKSMNYVISTGMVKLTAWPSAEFEITVPDTFSTVNSALYLLTDDGSVITTDDGTPILV